MLGKVSSKGGLDCGMMGCVANYMTTVVVKFKTMHEHNIGIIHARRQMKNEVSSRSERSS
jgi:uncharacterized DUF497 family protein